MTDLFNEWSSQTAVKIQPVTFTLDGITVDDTVILGRSATVSAAGTLSPDFLEGDAFKEAKSDLLGKFPVSWSVNGSSSTKIENGSLKVDPAETVTELTITATMGDETKTKTVTIAAPFEINTQPASTSVAYGYTTGPELSVGLSGKYTGDAEYQW